MATRDLLQKRLDNLEALMPELVRKHPERADLMQAFCRYSDRITEETTARDDAWVNDSLDNMLTRYGFPPQQDELPPDG